MGVVIPQVVTEDRASGALVVDGGLRFDSSKSHYLSRTPGSAGNRKTWTWSGWVKRTKLGTYQRFFSARNPGVAQEYMRFNNDDTITISHTSEGGTLVTTQVFRDISSSYHIVVSCDTTIASPSSDRIKIYVNGTRVTAFSGTYPNQNADFLYNSAVIHNIATGDGTTEYTDALISNQYFIDGQALGPEYFGYTDPLTNTWRPKKFKPQATPNNGTTWSSVTTASPGINGSYPITNLFDSSTSTDAITNNVSGTGTITFSPTTAIPYTNSVEVYITTGGANVSASLNGGAGVLLSNGSGWNTVTTGSGSISSLVLTRTNGAVAASAIRVDGVILVDGVNDPGGVGKNGFHLPFDGSAPIGQDQSGRGNNWTPVNFGGSAALDKATGALPILNTDGGGKTARVGVREEIVRSSTPTAIQGTVAFDGSGDYLSTAASGTDFTVGSGAFTIECFAYFNSFTGGPIVFSAGTGGVSGLVNSSGYLSLYRNGAGGYGSSLSTNQLTAGKWHHLAWVTSDGSQWYGYVDGVQGTFAAGWSGEGTTSPGYVGTYGNGVGTQVPNGFISNLRVIKGTALYTSNFTVPTAELTAVANTKLLCCQSPTSAGAAAVSPNISGINDGTVWSDNVVGGRSDQPATLLFDGSTSTYAQNTSGNTNPNTITITFPDISYSTSVEAYVQSSDTSVGINDGALSAITSGSFQTVVSGSGTLSKLVFSRASTNGCAVAAIRVDGVILVDPVTANGDAFATRSELSGSNILALPLVGNKEDVSSLVKGGGSNKTVTSVNAVASYTQSNFYGGSWYFDGSGDYLQTPDSTDFTMGSGDYTIEGWFYFNNLSATQRLFGQRASDASQLQFVAETNASGVIYYYFAIGDTNYQIEGNTLSTSQWNHIAIVRSGDIHTLYTNGVAVGLRTQSGSLDDRAQPFSIGRQGDYTIDTFNGYIQDFRIYKGVAKYTSNFIPASTNPDILPDTPSGVSYSSNLTKITDGAVSFDGSGDYLQIAYNSDWDLSNSDFTIEAFVNSTDVTTNYPSIIGRWQGAGQALWDFRPQSTDAGDNFFFIYNNGSSNIIVDSGAFVCDGSWHHLAVTRSGTNLYMFVDGVLKTTHNIGTATISNNTNVPLYIGYDPYGASYYKGFTSNLRLIKGTALYTSNFTPPSAPLTSTENTKLLCCKSNSLTGAYDVVPTSGINDGTIWSSLVSASSGIYLSRPVTNLFNGDTADSANGALIPAEGDRWTVTYDFGSVSTLRFYTYYPGGSTSNGTNAFEVNGSTVTPLSKTNGGWTSLPIAGGTLTSFGSKNTSLSGLDYCYVAAIEVDGTVLLDPLGVNGNASATNFNPFTTDINAVRGQESGYATWNPLAKGTDATLSNGNLDIAYGSASTRSSTSGTFGVSTDKWYWEVTITASSQTNTSAIMGIANTPLPLSNYPGFDSNGWGYDGNQGRKYNGSGGVSYGDVYGVGDVVSVAFDADEGSLVFYKNGVSQGTAFTGIAPGTYFPSIGDGSQTNTFSAAVNFGQKPFKFPPPAGFQPLTLANTPRPSIVRPDQYMGVVTYTGTITDTSSQTVTGLNFESDLVWIKRRDGTNSHQLVDSVRGTGKWLESSSSAIENSTNTNGVVTAINSNGFTLTGGSTNANLCCESGFTYVAWAWKAGGNSNTFNIDDVGYDTASSAGLTGESGVTLTGASIGTKQGFSIVSYLSTASDTGTGQIPHGLSQTPDFVIIKNRDWAAGSQGWPAWHSAVPDKSRYLDSTNAWDATEFSYFFNNTAPTSSVVNVSSNGSVSASNRYRSYGGSDNFIMYCWHSVPGFSKFGSYTGNGSTDGPVIITGFRPRWIMIKKTDTNTVLGNWRIIDTQRDTFNAAISVLDANASSSENTAGINYIWDILSNGFKIRSVGTQINNSGSPFIYAAFAEAPEFNLYGAQASAR